jgi:hypothetical protein
MREARATKPATKLATKPIEPATKPLAVNKGGRPRKYENSVERYRLYRQRKRERAGGPPPAAV